MQPFYYTFLEGGERPVAEAFANEKRRDEALGPIGLARFGRTSEAALEYIGYPPHCICIGHQLGEPGFQAVAGFILPHVSTFGEESGEFSVVIARVKYTLINGVWIAELPAWMTAGPLDRRHVEETCTWLASALEA